jgi:indole-3-glycerol phosphate synthase
MPGILDEIIAHKIQEVEQRKKVIPLELVMEHAKSAAPARDFHAALQRGSGPVRLLAEIKAASPSQGVIRADFDAANIAKQYEHCGASAISVLTDLKYFAGTDAHLQAASQASRLPILRKDFTVDEYQLYESKALGADAVLLMAQVLEPDIYSALLDRATALGLHVLAEGHTTEQIRFLVEIGAQTIGINNRDFTTMHVSLETTLRNRHWIPEDRVVVSQSGIFTRSEVEQLEQVGVDAIQVGTSIMQQGDVKKQLHHLLGND